MIKRNLFLIVSFAATLGTANRALAQYPTIPDDVKAQSEALVKEAYRRSDSAWQVAWPAVDNDAKRPSSTSHRYLKPPIVVRPPPPKSLATAPEKSD